MWRDSRMMLIAFLEGFTTLAFQMVALRKAVPYVWSSVVLTSIVIGIILLALSAGYFFGGKITSYLSNEKLLRRLQLYLLISALYYLLIVFPSFDFVLTALLGSVWYVVTLFIFSLVFFALPTFLASHTMPIITHISQWTKWYAAGKILFVSTIWSFLWSTITTLVLFPQMGVYRTGIFAGLILILCAVLIGFKDLHKWVAGVSLVLFATSSLFFRPEAIWFYKETPYQTIALREGVLDGKNVRVMQLNWWWASGIELPSKKSFFPYIRRMYDSANELRPKTIAVIGAAWCTLPQELAKLEFVERIDVIDLDWAVFPIAEQHFLQEPLDKKIHTITQSARGWIYDQERLWKKYDLIVIDAYNGTSLPDELVTKEFFVGLHNISDIVAANLISDNEMISDFSRSMISTMQSAWWNLYIVNASSDPHDKLWNVVIANRKLSFMRDVSPVSWVPIFTDDKNISDTLRVDVMYGKE